MKVEIQQIDPREIQVPTRLLHESLTRDQSAFSRYTFKHAGKHLYASYEQWENGFLRERDPDTELMFWMRAAAILQWLSAEGDKARELLGYMCTTPTQEIVDAWESIRAEGCERYIREALSEATE